MDIDSLTQAVTNSSSWAEAAETLGLSRRSGGRVKQLADNAGITTDHLASHMDPVSKPADYAFSETKPNRLSHRRAAIGVAIDWFLQRDYSVSLPVETEHYDLVVETPQGFRKIQVKSSEFSDRGKARAKLVRTSYDVDRGRSVQVPYQDGEVDDFFIVCSDGSRYLIPYASVRGMSALLLTDKYSAFEVSDR